MTDAQAAFAIEHAAERMGERRVSTLLWYPVMLATAMFLAGCAVPVNQRTQARPVISGTALHKVAPGETIEQIAADFRTTPAELARRNSLKTPGKLAPGTVLYIPQTRLTQETVRESRWWSPFGPDSLIANAARRFGMTGTTRKPEEKREATPVLARGGCEILRGPAANDGGRMPVDFVSYDVCARAGDVSANGYCWPVIGRISRPFDVPTNHRGIDICACEGTPVIAARGGKVLYSDNKLSNYGNVVIIDHGGGVATVYAHNRRNLVKAGQTVTRGQCIAEVGQTGNATTPHVHFEIRQNPEHPTNPRPLLP